MNLLFGIVLDFIYIENGLTLNLRYHLTLKLKYFASFLKAGVFPLAPPEGILDGKDVKSAYFLNSIFLQF